MWMFILAKLLQPRPAILCDPRFHASSTPHEPRRSLPLLRCEARPFGRHEGEAATEGGREGHGDTVRKGGHMARLRPSLRSP